MSKRCSIDEMGNIIQKEFEEYVELTTAQVKTICKEVADDVCDKIKEKAPVNTGAYKKSWGITQTENSSLGTKYTVHSKTRYQLTHLLENGHAKRNGGRTKAQPHISIGEALAIKKLKEKAGG